jgi:uncharacterized protein YxeA
MKDVLLWLTIIVILIGWLLGMYIWQTFSIDEYSNITWIPIKDDEVYKYLKQGYTVTCDNIRSDDMNRQFNCYARKGE